MNLTQTYPSGKEFDIKKDLKRYFDFLALKDDQDKQKQELDEKQEEERDEERKRLREEPDKAVSDKKEADKREKDADNEAKSL